ncbi:MAG: M23 family metallopeptidase [Leptospiraceae bacterium]|nr:M23 family metallopeptidase [Leptospiraceae bacterium]
MLVSALTLLPANEPQASYQPRFQWPLQQEKLPAIHGLTSTFAESRYDHFHNGLDISSLNQGIKPVASGSVLYSRHSDDDPWQPVPGPGNYLFLGHGQGWLSGYYHLKADKPLKRRGLVQNDTIIAYSGNSGHSAGAHLHFFMARDHGREILNPLSLLPPASDSLAPVIGQLVIKTPQANTLISHSRLENIRLSQSWPVQVTIIDPGLEKHTRRGIYQLEWSLNNGAWEKRQYDKLYFKNGDWLLEQRYPFESIFQYGYYNLGALDFKQGLNRLQLRARDIQQNQTEVLYEINVNKEY